MPGPDLRLNPNAEITVHPIADRLNCIIVDDFLAEPDAVVDFAAQHHDQFAIPPMSYPGPVMDIDPGATGDLLRFIKSRMSRYFPFMRGGLELTTMLSMTSLQPADLSNLQRLCHSDPSVGHGRAKFASLLYLFRDADLGGTGFYRWKDRPLMERATALEMQDPTAALAFLQEQFPTYNKPPCYITESNEIAELIGVVPARFNRWVFYSGDIPHSGFIKSPEKLTTDFATGRLTLNCFASAVPK